MTFNPKTKLNLNSPYLININDMANNIVPNLKLFDNVPYLSNSLNDKQRAQTARSLDNNNQKLQYTSPRQPNISIPNTRQPQRPQSANSNIKSGPRSNAAYKVKNSVVPSLTKQQQLASHNHHNHYINELSQDDDKNIRLEARLEQPKFEPYHAKER